MIELRANAKINLFLDILAKLPNGYHSLFMVMQSVSLADIVTVSENGEGIIRLTCSEPALPTDSKNIAYRAAQAFLEEAGLVGRGVDIHIEKHIPFEAGLAGGSADSPSTRAAYSPIFRRLKAALSCSQSPQRASRLRAPTGISIPRTIYIIRTRLVCSTPPQTAISRAYAVTRATSLSRR